ncbi:MAG: FtsX-like permease family protein [bacterium]|nr:FtsX-like permease family protein [bacterium]
MKKSADRSPRYAFAILGMFLDRTGNYGLFGDIEEMYKIFLRDRGRSRSFIWLWIQILRLVPVVISEKISWNITMLKNYFKITFRNIMRSKVYSLINIFGLSLGLTCCILIVLYVKYEMSYDSFHEYSDNIYRVSHYSRYADGEEYDSHVYLASLAPSLTDEFPEVEYAVRFHSPFDGYLATDEKRFLEHNISYADQQFFGLFSFDLFTGDKNIALNDPYSIVLTEDLASKYFDDEDPIGKIIKLNNETVLTVTGIVKNPPANSDLKFSALISFSTLYKLPGLYLDWNGGNRYITYLKLAENASMSEFESKLPAFLKRHTPFYPDEIRHSLYLQPLRDIHLHVDGYINNVVLFSAIAFVILLIGCINSMNMTTARSAKRAKEIGIRKVSGANRKELLKQFIGESFVMSVVGFAAGIILLILVLPAFSNFTGKELTVLQLLDFRSITGLLLLVLSVGVLSGSYPAFYMSSFQPADIIDGKLLKKYNPRINLKSALVIFQFAVSIALIIFTSYVYMQLDYIKNRRLGFTKDNILVVPLTGKDIQGKYDILKNEFGSLAEVKGVGASSDYPGRGLTTNGYIPEGIADPMQIHVLEVDYDYLELMNIELETGRMFSPEYSTDNTACIINRALVKKLGWTEPIGKTINRNIDYTIIGVVEDFNFAPLYQNVSPLFITPNRHDQGYRFVSLRIDGGNIFSAMESIEERWKSVTASESFEYFFLDELIDSVYKDERKFGEMFKTFAFLTLLIACLGLFGLVSFMVEQHVKEIGIRKALGASIPEVLLLVTKSYAVWILMANIISWPIAWYSLNQWLQDFAYRVDISIIVFILSGAACFAIALLSVGYLSIKAARANPVNSLRYE